MKQLQKHLIIILVMGIMLAAALIGGISTFTFREISSNDNRAIMKSIQQTDMEELNDTLRVTAQTVNALTASYADIVPDDLSLLKDPEFLSAYEDKTENLGYHLLSENFKIASLYYRLSPELTNNPQAGYTVARSADGIGVLKLTPVNLHKFDEDDMNHVGWYYVPVSRKEPTWLPLYYNTMMGGQCISYVRPIYKGDTLISIVGADIDFDEFCKRINNMTAYESGFAVLFGPRGDLLFDGNRSVHIPQETIDKIAELAALRLEWHFIGPLQSNKTRQVAEHVDWMHSVERLKIAERLSQQRPAQLTPLNVCLQVNVSGEASKSGYTLEEVPALAVQIAALPNIRLRGLMCIPEPADDFEAQRQPFRCLRELYENLQAQGLLLDTLSMGMSHDMEAAIAEGATIVRVGTAIFGDRNKQ